MTIREKLNLMTQLNACSSTTPEQALMNKRLTSANERSHEHTTNKERKMIMSNKNQRTTDTTENNFPEHIGNLFYDRFITEDVLTDLRKLMEEYPEDTMWALILAYSFGILEGMNCTQEQKNAQ